MSALSASLLMLLGTLAQGTAGPSLREGESAELGANDCALRVVALGAGDLLHVEIEPLRTDLRLRILDPAGGVAWASDDRPGNEGGEEAWLVAASSGNHGLEVCGRSPGAFRVTRVERRPAAAGDRARAEAEAALRRARSARASGGDLERASEDASAARAAFRALGVPGKEGLALIEEALLESRARRHDQASALLQEAAALARRVEDGALEARALTSLAVRHYQASDLIAAVAGGRAALAAAVASRDAQLVAQAQYNLGLFLSTNGQADEALHAYQEALNGCRRLGLAREELAALNNLGVVHKGRRRYAAALGVNEQVIARAEALGDRIVLGAARINEGALFMLMGEPERARRSYLEALRALPADERLRRAQAIWNLGHLAQTQGEVEEAVARVTEAEALARAAGDAEMVARSAGLLGTMDLEAGRIRSAQERLVAASEQARSAGLPGLLQETLVELGEARRQGGDAAGSAAAAEECLSLGERTRDVELAAKALLLRARLQRDARQPVAAMKDVDQALQALEELRGELPTRALRATYLAVHRSAFDLAIEIELELERQQPGARHAVRAFELAERARARSLLEAVSYVTWASDAQSLELRERADDVAAARERLAQIAASRSAPAEVRAGAERALDEALVRYQRQREAFASARPRVAGRLERQPATLDEVQAALEAGEALLEYHLGREKTFLFVVTRGRFEALPLGPTAAIEAAVAAFLEHLRVPTLLGRGRLLASARSLFSLVAQPARIDPAAVRRWLVSPDGVLRRVPFEALSGPRRMARGADFLTRHFEFAYEPSAAVWLELRARRRPAATPARGLVVAAPTLPPVGPDRMRGDPGPLPGAREEARNVARLAAGATVLTGSQASEHRVRGLARNAGLLHFATHAEVDDRRPALSSLLLAAGDGEDGRLEAWEIAGLELEAELATLSACASALGRPVAGEGLLGLVQAFLDGGVRAVVGTLWPISDRGSVEFMTAFYRELRHSPPAQALATARRQALRRGGLAAHPHYWAPFVLIGPPGRPETGSGVSGRPMPVDPGRDGDEHGPADEAEPADGRHARRRRAGGVRDVDQ